MAIGDWTEERVRILKRHWKKDKSAREIAEMIGLSRNAVIGKAQRIFGPSKPAEAKSEAMSRAQTKRWGKRKLAPRTPKLTLVESSPVTMAQLTETMCRYPFGDRPSEMTFCAAPAQPGSSFCPTHHARCWDDPTTRKSRGGPPTAKTEENRRWLRN